MSAESWRDHRESQSVLHIADSWEGGGAETVFRQTVAASQNLGWRAEVLVSERRRNPLSYIFSSKNARMVEESILRSQATVIHLQNYYHFISPSVLWAVRRLRQRGYTMRVIHTAHDFHLLCPNGHLQHFVRGERRPVPWDLPQTKLLWRYDERSWAHSALKVAQHVLAYRVLKVHREIDTVAVPSRFLGRAVQRRYPELRMKVLRNPVAMPSVVFSGSHAGDDDSGSAGPIRLVFLGRLSAEKGLSEFLRTLAVLADTVDWSLDIIGDGQEREALRRVVQEVGIDHRVTFRGSIPQREVGQALAERHVLVLPSVGAENAPLTIIEAAARGLPVIANDRGGAAEMIEHTAFGVACDTRDPGQVSDALVHLRSRVGENALLDPALFSHETFERSLHMLYTNGQSVAPHSTGRSHE